MMGTPDKNTGARRRWIEEAQRQQDEEDQRRAWRNAIAISSGWVAFTLLLYSYWLTA